MNSGDVAWMLAATALVMFMTPGLALFYGGLVRTKNVLATIMQSFILLGVVAILWVVFGYSIAFGTDQGGFIGSLEYLGLAGVGLDPGPYSKTIPHILFCAFQLMFAIITPALITGAFAERMKFSAYLAFTVLWTVLVYFPVCHWVWGGGWLGLGKLGALDFAGGTVIHINSACAALVCAIVVGKRMGHGTDQLHPHNVPMSVLGAGILWFGWFGFNAGSALAANGQAAMALFVTHIAAGTAAVTWVLAEWIYQGKPTTLGAASGAVAGLVAITPAAGFVGPMAAIAIGGVAGVICYFAIVAKSKLGYDDALDVVAVHGVGGLWGALSTGLFACAAYGGVDGLFYGNPKQFGIQAIGAFSAIAYSTVLSIIIIKVLDKTMGIRASQEDEFSGMDLSQHSEVAYRT
ncbi:MAG: ammonium transporter [Deltaproteobacteria bacterium]|nr:ammonium transporter [Deltaproteobacteria bacterium]